MVYKSKEKESEKEVNDKKRRKSSTTTEIPNKVLKEDIYASVVKFEEYESQHRQSDKDTELFHEICGKINKIIREITELKLENTEKAKDEINNKKIEASHLFVILKKLNRLDKIRLRSGRDALQKEKTNVNSNRLQLQNLLYEAEHLRKEVQRCFQFKSQDEDIDLVTEEEFYEKAPELISRPEKTKENEHMRRLARLEWELQQRKELASLLQELQLTKEKLAKEIELQTDSLDSLAPRLDALLKATRPIQEVLNMDIEKNWEIQKTAQLLPKPLYLVYINLSAYSEACDNLLEISIYGDEEEAKLSCSEKEKEELDENSQDSDADDNNDDNERSSKSHHHRRQSKAVLLELKKSKLFKPHPLSVGFKIKTKESAVCLELTLYYLTALNFITVNCTISNVESGGLTASEVISPDSVLNNLVPNDMGHESPSPKTKYQLMEYSIEPDCLWDHLKEKNLGKPFKWAQQLCGLQFMASINCFGDISHNLAQTTIPNIIKKLRFRWQSRLSLYKQIHSLENLSLISANKANLSKWISISWPEYSSVPATVQFVEENVAMPHDLFYKAIITRGSAKLDCYISISPNFPLELPLWAIQLNWNGSFNAQNNTAIKEIESWINAINVTKNVQNILENQLNRATASMDIYLETEDSLSGSLEYQPGKTFLKAFRYRTRSRPFKIIENTGSIVYTQI